MCAYCSGSTTTVGSGRSSIRFRSPRVQVPRGPPQEIRKISAGKSQEVCRNVHRSAGSESDTIFPSGKALGAGKDMRWKDCGYWCCSADALQSMRCLCSLLHTEEIAPVQPDGTQDVVQCPVCFFQKRILLCLRPCIKKHRKAVRHHNGKAAVQGKPVFLQCLPQKVNRLPCGRPAGADSEKIGITAVIKLIPLDNYKNNETR